MSLKGFINELESIDKELKRLTERRKYMTNRKRHVKKKISEMMKRNDEKAVKYNGRMYEVTSKESRDSKKKSERDDDALKVFHKYGVRDPVSLLKEVLEARRGTKVNKNDLIIKTIK